MPSTFDLDTLRSPSYHLRYCSRNHLLAKSRLNRIPDILVPIKNAVSKNRHTTLDDCQLAFALLK